MATTIEERLQLLLRLYRERGDDAVGNPVTELQCSAVLEALDQVAHEDQDQHEKLHDITEWHRQCLQRSLNELSEMRDYAHKLSRRLDWAWALAWAEGIVLLIMLKLLLSAAGVLD